MTLLPSPFAVPSATPYYPEYPLYSLRARSAVPWEFNGWKRESLSWKKGCYIHGGLSGPGGQYLFRGPQAAEFLASICVNGFDKFRIGAAKHAVMCTDDGLIASHGVMQRLDADTFRLFAAGPWAAFMHSRAQLDVEMVAENNYLFQVAGPTSLQVLEAATGEDLKDIAFLRYRDSRIAGRKVQIMRIGMAGTLAYELHGPMDDGPQVYDAVVRAGEPMGLERLGWMTYSVNHIEGGFPQANWTFFGAAQEDTEFMSFVSSASNVRWAPPSYSGSIDPQDRRARYRTLTEVGWESSAKLDHDFKGRAAVEKDLRDARRTIVTLEWNADDVIDVYASLFRDGQEFKYVEMPTSPHFRVMLAHADRVTLDGRAVGVASGTCYSYYFRQMISHCMIDRDLAADGTEVIVHWGDHGGRIKEIRAKVARFPYLQEGRNQSVRF